MNATQAYDSHHMSKVPHTDIVSALALFDESDSFLFCCLQVQLRRRGFYPQGKGEATCCVRCLGDEQALPGFTLMERGQVGPDDRNEEEEEEGLN